LHPSNASYTSQLRQIEVPALSAAVSTEAHHFYNVNVSLSKIARNLYAAKG
jgi:hypothetical protein